VLAGLLGGSSVASTKPLAALIAKYVTRSMVEQVAREHEPGRWLLIGTTNADQERQVIWDLGRIAIQRSPKALALFRRVLLASAALPGLFPLVYVKVTDTDGKTYEEMHVDGGVIDNAFLGPVHLNLAKLDRSRRLHWRRTLFILANAKTAPTRKVVKATTFEIAARLIDSLIRQQLKGDLVTLYLRAQNNKMAFKLTDMPKSFFAESKEAFDKVYMRKLYDVGYQRAMRGFQWKTKPPGGL
jgi:hypothetical protein